MSHACGTGERVPSEIVKLILLLKIQSLSYGHSGVQLATVERLIDFFFNNDVLPVVYQQGSLGASGDLAPLAHMSLPLLGLGEVGVRRPCPACRRGTGRAGLAADPARIQGGAGPAQRHPVHERIRRLVADRGAPPETSGPTASARCRSTLSTAASNPSATRCI